MTVSTEVNHNEYTGNGVTTSFPYTFRIFHASDLVVTTSDMNGVLRTLILNTDYTVTGIGSYSGGAVVLPLPLANAWAISIERSLPVVQETDLRNQGKFFAETHEGAFDYLTMLIQQCFSWARLALLKPNFLAKYYDAKQNRIANLADPIGAKDAVNYKTALDLSAGGASQAILALLADTNNIDNGDGLLGVKLPFPGGVPRTQHDQNQDFISIRQFLTGSETDHTAAFLAAQTASPSGFFVQEGTYIINAAITAPLVTYGKVNLQGTGSWNVIDLSQPIPDGSTMLNGRKAVQVFQLTPPTTIPSGKSTVSQGLMIDEQAGTYYCSWDDGSGNSIIRKFDAGGKTLSEYTLPGVGHCDSFSKVVRNGVTSYLIGGSYGNDQKIIILANDAVSQIVPTNNPDGVGGILVAVDQYDYSKVAIYYLDAAGQPWITYDIPIADVFNGSVAPDLNKKFRISLGSDSVAAINPQAFGYYRGEFIVWAGNDSRSGQKNLYRFNKYGEQLEVMDVQVDRVFADVEGNITEPEGLSICRNPNTNECDIHLTKCFGTHAAAIIRIYKMIKGGEAGSQFEGMSMRAGAGQTPTRVVTLPMVFTKVTGGWVVNAGSVIAENGLMYVSNIRIDEGGVPGLYFDLHKPYVSLVGFSVNSSAGLIGARIQPGWTVNLGGSASKSGHKISFWDDANNAFISANAAALTNGMTFCFELRVAFGK